MSGESVVEVRSQVSPSTQVPSQPPVRIETLDMALAGRRRPITTPLSIGLHVLAVAAVVVVPLFTTEELPQLTTSVRAFFVEPAAVTPPPPPPPPPAAAPRTPAARATASVRAPDTFVAPVVTPETVQPDDGLDLGVEGGVPGGVEGGVPGGVVGGVIGGLPSSEALPRAAVRVGGAIKEPRKVKHVPPEYPELAREARVKGVVIIEAVIGADGRVMEAKILRSVALLDDSALAAVRQWIYTPTLYDGVPVPVILTVTVSFKLAT